MENSFLEKLINPKTNSPLVFNEKLQVLVDKSTNTTFPIINNVPILLVASETKIESISDLHLKLDSDFNYTDHYQKDAEEYDYATDISNKATLHEYKRLYEKILNQIPNTKSTVLDVGCGKAWVAEHLLKRVNTNIISFDISNLNPIKALKKFPNKNHFGLVGDVFNIPIKENSIQRIVACEIIEHVANPKIFISKLITVLEKEGILVITTPYDEKLKTSLCIHCNKPTPHHAHIHSFNEKNFIQYLPKIGIEYSLDKFNNKFLLKLRSHIIFQFFPHSIWNIMDKIANKLLGSPTRLLIKIIKK